MKFKKRLIEIQAVISSTIKNTSQYKVH